MSSYWIFKTEPETYSFDDLEKDGLTNWNGVRNFQARNFLRECKKGDEVLIYHSGDEKAVIGVATICKEAYLDPEKGEDHWVQVDIKPKMRLKWTVPLKTLKSEKSLNALKLIRQSRLSVSPATKEEFEAIIRLSKKL